MLNVLLLLNEEARISKLNKPRNESFLFVTSHFHLFIYIYVQLSYAFKTIQY